MKKNYVSLGLTLMVLTVPVNQSMDYLTQHEYENMSTKQTQTFQPVVHNQYSIPHVTKMPDVNTPNLGNSHAIIVKDNNQLYKNIATSSFILAGLSLAAYGLLSKKKD